MLRKQRTLIAVVVLSVVLLAQYGRSQDISPKSCKTPKDESGICVALRRCPPLSNLLRPEVRSQENLFYLQNSTCKTMETNIKYCCPTSKVTGVAVSPSARLGSVAPSEDVNEQPKDVSTSPRLNMLPLEVCGEDESGKVIHGNWSEVSQFPWMALLMLKTTPTHIIPFCGGSLINNRYVLTAAHCVDELDHSRLLVVRLGELNTSNETDCTGLGPSRVCAPPIEEYTVENVVIHPDFGKPSRHLNDIALLRLNETVTFKPHIAPICLPIGNEQTKNLPAKQKLFVSGWGATENGTTSPHLLFGTVPVVSQEKCVESYSKTRLSISSTRQLCAGGTSTDSCYGDSGGPLSYFGDVNGRSEIVQYGIVSFGPSGCAIKDKPGVYTRVGFYMDWILNTLKP